MSSLLDDFTFYSLLSVLQGGMWLLNDLERYLQKFDISFGRFSILLAASDPAVGKINASELAMSMGKSKATISKLLKKLKAEGLLKLEKSEDDGRVFSISLLPAGQSLLNRIIPGYNERLKRMSAPLGQKDKLLLVKLISRIDFFNPYHRIRGIGLRAIGKSLKEKARNGSPRDIDDIFALLDENTDLPATKLIDFYLGTVTNPEGILQIERYFFEGTQLQRNYCALFFARRNEWGIVNKAYDAGLIDYKQAYSR